MKKWGLLLSTTVIAIALSGCSSPKQTEQAPVVSAGQECADTVLTTAKGKSGTRKFTHIQREDSFVVRFGNSSQEEHVLTPVPYAEATALDNGKPGSAWISCMSGKGFTITKQ
ncbi:MULTISPECIES: hypothetical protein [Kosakonia]|uniref:Lipoprotein n=1 Tax=Kosakonia sacchari TaxID=1158459 RepID=A0ABZ0MWR4_9ENTR|nr:MULTISPECIES: hypothetical protein [Kosakonia]WOZ79959.1 hypothetical protein Q8Y70_23660 [Kosakonia sacchari]